MKLAKILGRVGFIVGFLPPVLFYTPFLPTWESDTVCPRCPIVDIFSSDPNLAYLGYGLIIGLIWGLGLALAGFGIGYGVSRLKRAV